MPHHFLIIVVIALSSFRYARMLWNRRAINKIRDKFVMFKNELEQTIQDEGLQEGKKVLDTKISEQVSGMNDKATSSPFKRTLRVLEV